MTVISIAARAAERQRTRQRRVAYPPSVAEAGAENERLAMNLDIIPCDTEEQSA